MVIYTKGMFAGKFFLAQYTNNLIKISTWMLKKIKTSPVLLVSYVLRSLTSLGLITRFFIKEILNLLKTHKGTLNVQPRRAENKLIQIIHTNRTQYSP